MFALIKNYGSITSNRFSPPPKRSDFLLSSANPSAPFSLSPHDHKSPPAVIAILC